MKIKLLFFFILFLTPTLSFAETKDELFSLIKQRLQYAEDVALYKFNNSKPISDLQREEIILSSSRGLAEKYNLDPKSLQNFIQSQINANKSIQYRNFANWMSSPPTPKNINLEKIRSDLDVINNKILHNISIVLKNDPIKDSDYDKFSQIVDVKNLTTNDKKELFKALKGIKNNN